MDREAWRAVVHGVTNSRTWLNDWTELMWYCSLQHRILLSSPSTSTIDHSFRFGPVTSFFLELLVVVLSSSLVAHGTFWREGLSFGIILLTFYTVLRILMASTLEWLITRSSSGSCQNSPIWPVHLGWPCTAWLLTLLP